MSMESTFPVHFMASFLWGLCLKGEPIDGTRISLSQEGRQENYCEEQSGVLLKCQMFERGSMTDKDRIKALRDRLQKRETQYRRELRIPGEPGHRFRSKLDTHSGPNWTPIPVEAGHFFSENRKGDGSWSERRSDGRRWQTRHRISPQLRNVFEEESCRRRDCRCAGML